jgi:hypothetical protein
VTIRVIRCHDFGVNISIYSGKITREELIRHYSAIDADDAASADRWISYFAPSADLSELDIAAMAELKRLTSAKIREVYGDRPLAVAIVCDSRINEPILSVWRSYLGADVDHPTAPGMFSSLRAACDWLGAPAARDAIAAMIGDERDGRSCEAIRTFRSEATRETKPV